MKFKVLDNYTKTVSVVFCVLVWLIFGSIYLITRLNGISLWNEFAEVGVWATSILVLVIAVLILSTIFLVPFDFSHVELGESGIKLCLGKIRLNKMNWSQVRRVEIFEDRNIYGLNRLIINILMVDQETKMSKRHVSAPNWERKRITFLYNREALVLLQKYVLCDIQGLNLAEEYNAKPLRWWQK